MTQSREYFVCYRYTGPTTTKLLRIADEKIPIFTSQVLAYTYLAGFFRPFGDETTRSTKTVTWPGHWVLRRHSYYVNKRSVRITKNHIIDPPPPHPPMEVA